MAEIWTNETVVSGTGRRDGQLQAISILDFKYSSLRSQCITQISDSIGVTSVIMAAIAQAVIIDQEREWSQKQPRG